MTEVKERRMKSLNEMFGEVNQITNDSDREEKDQGIENGLEIDTTRLVPFPNHPFKLYSGQRFADMVRSIKEFGVLAPLLVRQKDSITYEILSGHNRWNAAKEVGLEKVPIRIINGLSDEEAMLIVTETNLLQRSLSDLAHSERAFVLASHHRALKTQGRNIQLINEIKEILENKDWMANESLSPMGTSNSRSDSLSPLGTSSKNCREIGAEYNLSKNSVARYIRIHELIGDLKEYIDTEEISIRAGVNLSYLTKEHQNSVAQLLKNSSKKLDMKKAEFLREYETVGELTENKIREIVWEEGKAKEKANIQKGFKPMTKIYYKYFNQDYELHDIEDIIDKALELYFQQKELLSQNSQQSGDMSRGDLKDS